MKISSAPTPTIPHTYRGVFNDEPTSGYAGNRFELYIEFCQFLEWIRNCNAILYKTVAFETSHLKGKKEKYKDVEPKIWCSSKIKKLDELVIQQPTNRVHILKYFRENRENIVKIMISFIVATKHFLIVFLKSKLADDWKFFHNHDKMETAAEFAGEGKRESFVLGINWFNNFYKFRPWKCMKNILTISILEWILS